MGNYDKDVTAERIKTRRKKDLKLTQGEIAKRAGITLQTLSTYENGSIPRMDILWDLADALECEPDYLLGRISNPRRDVSEVADQIPLSGDAIAGLIDLKDCIDNNRGFYLFDGIVDDEIDAKLVTVVIDCVIQELCDSESPLLQALLDIKTAYCYEASHLLPDGRIVGDYRSSDVARMSKANSVVEIGRLMGLCVQKSLDRYFMEKRTTEEA